MAARTYEGFKEDFGKKAQVNAIIIDLFAQNPNSFIEGFRAKMGQKPSGEDKRFQNLLDAMRDEIAANLSQYPKAQNNGFEDKWDLTAQIDALRKIRDTLSAPRYDAAHIQKIAATPVGRSGVGDITLPKPDWADGKIPPGLGDRLLASENSCPRYPCATASGSPPAQFTPAAPATAAPSPTTSRR